MKILVRGVNWLGDAVMTIPALMRLREAQPAAQITLLSPDKLADLWRHHPAINHVLTFPPSDSLRQVARRLRDGKFDCALVLPNSPRSALEPWWAGIPQRIGYARPWRNWFLTQRLRPEAPGVSTAKRPLSEIHRLIQNSQQVPKQVPTTAHHIYHYLPLAALLGAKPEPLAPVINVLPEEVTIAIRKFGLARYRDAGVPLLGLNPGAEYGPAKRWPLERYAQAAIEVQRRTPCVWVILGGLRDADQAGSLAAQISQASPMTAGAKSDGPSRAVSVAGRTSLRELCAILRACRLLLTNDTGPMHVGAAVGTFVVAIFGSTSPALTGPGLPGSSSHCVLQAQVPCAPCFRRTCPIDFRCMNSLRVEQVVEAVSAFLTYPIADEK